MPIKTALKDAVKWSSLKETNIQRVNRQVCSRNTNQKHSTGCLSENKT